MAWKKGSENFWKLLFAYVYSCRRHKKLNFKLTMQSNVLQAHRDFDYCYIYTVFVNHRLSTIILSLLHSKKVYFIVTFWPLFNFGRFCLHCFLLWSFLWFERFLVLSFNRQFLSHFIKLHNENFLMFQHCRVAVLKLNVVDFLQSPS